MILLKLFFFGLLITACHAREKKSTKSFLTQTTELDPTITSYLMYHITDGPIFMVTHIYDLRIDTKAVPLADVPNAVRHLPPKTRDSITKTNIPMALTAMSAQASMMAKIVQQAMSAAQATPHLYDSSLLASLSEVSTLLSMEEKVLSERVSELDAGQTPAWWIQPERGGGSPSAYQVGAMHSQIGAGGPRCAFAHCSTYHEDGWLLVEGYGDTAAVNARASPSPLTTPTSDPSTTADLAPPESNGGSWIEGGTFVHAKKTFVARGSLARESAHVQISELGGPVVRSERIPIEDMLLGKEHLRARLSERAPTPVHPQADTRSQVTPPPADRGLDKRGSQHKHCRGLPGWNGHGGRSECYVSSCMAQYEGDMTMYGVRTYLNDKSVNTTSRFTSTIKGPHWGITRPNISTTHGWGNHRTVEAWQPECTDRDSCWHRCAKMVERGYRFGWIVTTIFLGVTVAGLTGVLFCMCCQRCREVNQDDRPDDQNVERGPRGRRQERGSVFASGADNAGDQPGNVRPRNVAGPAEV